MATPSVRLTPADDLYFGTDTSEDIFGLDGSDMIFGGGGGDRLFSNDEFSFTYWDDRTLTDPASYLDGGDGNDEIESFATDFAVGIGGAGNDDVIARSYGSAFGRGGSGNDVVGVSGEQGDAWAYGGQGNDIVAVKARYGHARGFGGAGDDELSADHSARATLRGGAGGDVLVVTGATTEQVTVMAGGTGADVMQGDGDGVEIYRFGREHTGVGDRADRVWYFDEEDRIDLSGIDADGDEPGDQGFTWRGRGGDPSVGEISYRETSVDDNPAILLRFNDGHGEHEIILIRPGDTNLAADDFLL
jgi:Ca2+-binding RTX toxin-like protein